MRMVIYILIVVVALLMILCYSLMVIAHDADERAEEMYRAWKEKQTERSE